MRSLLLGLLIISLVAAACTGPQPTRDTDVTTTATYTPKQTFDPGQDVTARTFKDEEELKAFLSSTNSDYGGVYYDIAGSARSAAPMMAEAADGAVAKTGGGAPNGFSETNNQVAGVDEADIIKTDGEYIYTVSGTTLFIIKAYPGADAQIVKTLELPSQPTGLFVEGDRLAVFGNFYDLDYFKRVEYTPRNGMTYLTIYDIADKAAPASVKEYKFEGNYFSARMHEGTIYLLAQSTPTVKYPTPTIIDGDAVRTMPASDIYHYPVPYDNVQYVTVHALGIAGDAEALSSKAVAVQWDNKLYASENNIYLTYTEQVNEWEIRQDIMIELLEPRLTQADRDLIEKIKNTDDEVLNQAEKRAKIQQVYLTYANYLTESERRDFEDELDKRLEEKMKEYDALTYTIISRISMRGTDLAVEATGKVPGSVYSQFAMDEHNDVLRVATTLQNNRWIRPLAEPTIAADEPMAKTMPAREWRSESTNNVYTLDMGLNVIGRLEGLAESESIFSTRFIDDRLYMVTFRQVDPFFVIDLADPQNPKELGQLKIPGFSRYLHPYDENTIIGIGRDASDTGRQKGIKVSLFDVTDVAKPREIAKFVEESENSQSAAEWEHKAFLFDRQKELLVIPAYSYDWEYQTGNGRERFNGAMVFNITRSNIDMRGIIDHSQGNSQYWGPMVERSLWIEDMLYTKSPQLLRINKISDLSKVKNLELHGNNSGPYPVY